MEAALQRILRVTAKEWGVKDEDGIFSDGRVRG